MSASNAAKASVAAKDPYQGMPQKRLRAIRRLKPNKRRPKVRMWEIFGTLPFFDEGVLATRDKGLAQSEVAALQKDYGPGERFEVRRVLVKR